MAVKLIEMGGAVGLGFEEVGRGKPFVVDFLTPSWRSKIERGLPRNHIFRRALGATKALPRICDATAGFGSDAVLALTLGCEVVAIERSELVAKVLIDGIRRAELEDAKFKTLFAKFKLIEGESANILRELKPRPEVVYLDPMFEKPKKTAKSPKAMQLLQDLLGEDPVDERALFGAAMESCTQRVVVKRPLKAPPIAPASTHSFKGQSIRYDVYLKS